MVITSLIGDVTGKQSNTDQIVETKVSIISDNNSSSPIITEKVNPNFSNKNIVNSMNPESINAGTITNDINNPDGIEKSYSLNSLGKYTIQKRKLVPMVVIVNKRKSHPVIHEPTESNSENDMIICEEETKSIEDTAIGEEEKSLEIIEMEKDSENQLGDKIPILYKSKSLSPLIGITQSLKEGIICEEQVYPTIGQVEQISDTQFGNEMGNRTNSNSSSQITLLSETELNTPIITKEEVFLELAQCKSNLTEMVQQTDAHSQSHISILSEKEQSDIITKEEELLEIEEKESNLNLPETIQNEIKINTKEEIPLSISGSNLTLPEIIQNDMPSESSKIQLKCILKGFNDVKTIAKQPKETRKITLSTKKPKGCNQDFIILKALCNLPNREGTRSEIIKAALELEKKMCRESKLGKFFKGKTPGNSISASLTCNYKNIYTRIDKPGDRVQRFKATFPLDDAPFAIAKYKEWTQIIYDTMFKSIYDPQTYPQLVKKTKKKLKLEYKQFKQVGKNEIELINPNFLKINKPGFLRKKKKPSDDTSLDVNPSFGDNITLSNQSIEINGEASNNSNDTISISNPNSSKSNMDVNPSFNNSIIQPIQAPLINEVVSNGSNDITSTTNPTSENDSKKRKHKDKQMLPPPTNWKQLFEVKTSTIPGAGYGLFALRFIPKGTVIGYYFGVPTTEYDFDKYKGLNEYTESYSIRYSNFVLDATDDNFKLFTEQDGGILCPFHYMNEHPKYTNCSFREGPKLNQIEVFTECDIFEGQELSVFYGCEYYRGYVI